MPQYIQQYTYDASTNLVNLKHQPDGGTVTGRYQPVRTTSNRQQTEQYDSVGNQVSREGSQDLAYNSDGSLAYLSWQDGGYQITEYYTYTSPGVRGRKVTEVRTLLTNMLVQVDTVSYVGEVEFRASYTGTNLSYDGDLVTDESGNEISPTAQCSVTRIKSGHGQVGKIDKNELTDTQTIRYNVLNHLDSNELVLDEDGQLAHYRSYAPYGETLDETKADNTESELGYSGQEEDESGLVYYGHRYYQKNGVWNRADPIRFESKQLNLYNLVDGNPVTSRDEMGLFKPLSLEEFVALDKTRLMELRTQVAVLKFTSNATKLNELGRRLDDLLPRIDDINDRLQKFREGIHIYKAYTAYINEQDDYGRYVRSITRNDVATKYRSLMDSYHPDVSENSKKWRLNKVKKSFNTTLLNKLDKDLIPQIFDAIRNDTLTEGDWNALREHWKRVKDSNNNRPTLAGLQEAAADFGDQEMNRLASLNAAAMTKNNDAHKDLKADWEGFLHTALAFDKENTRISGKITKPRFELSVQTGDNSAWASGHFTGNHVLQRQNSSGNLMLDAHLTVRQLGINKGNVQNIARNQYYDVFKAKFENILRRQARSGRLKLAWNPKIVDLYAKKLYTYQKSIASLQVKNSNRWKIQDRYGNIKNADYRNRLPDNLVGVIENTANNNMKSVAWIGSGPYKEDNNPLAAQWWRSKVRESNQDLHNELSGHIYTYHDAAKQAIIEIINTDNDNNFELIYSQTHENDVKDSGLLGLKTNVKAHADELVVRNAVMRGVNKAKQQGAAIESKDIKIISWLKTNDNIYIYTRCPGCHSATHGVEDFGLYEQ